MNAQQLLPIWRYHGGRLLRSASAWIMIVIIALMAGTQGIITQHMPAIMQSLAGPEMASVLATSIPEPSWQQAYAGWMKNLSQIITLALITINAIGYASLTNNGDIPFMLTKNVQRSHYLSIGTLTTWCATLTYALIGSTLAWAGIATIFHDAPYLPVLLATFVWALELVLINGFQILASTLKPGVGAPLVAGLGIYLLIAIAGVFDKLGNYSPLGLNTLSSQIVAQADQITWAYTVGTSIVVSLTALAGAVYVFNRSELG